MLAVFIPVVLLGIKYSNILFDFREKSVRDINSGGLYKRCAREAALAVAQNWNPGLTLGQQRAGVYKVADAVYNAAPCYQTIPIAMAIPGVVITDKQSDSETQSLQPSAKTIEYTNSTLYYRWFYARKYAVGDYTTWNPSYSIWLAVDKASDSSKRVSNFDELDATEKSNGNYVLNQHEIYKFPHPKYTYIPDTASYPTDSYYSSSTGSIYSYLYWVSPNTTSASEHANYNLKTNIASYTTPTSYSSSDGGVYSSSTCTTRSTESDKDYVEISIASGDKIKVKTDEQIAYAQPAQCNVDIVLAIPTNGAACNQYNRDAASDTAGTPNYTSVTTSETNSTLAATPIYQMGQACKNFVKDNWYHVRGVTMGLIPYSAKVSLSPTRTAWTTAIRPFVETPEDTAVMLGACLYATSGVKDAPLVQGAKTKSLVHSETLPTTDTSYYWGGVLTGCPIMCRRGTLTCDSRYGNNYIAGGLLLNTTNPTSGEQYKYRRMNLNPCYGGYANIFFNRCERRYTHFLPNPYYMIEPTADLVKIYEMCNALYPIYDLKNVSNFIFIPLEWANNFFQSWTNNPSASTATGTADSAVLSRPGKTTSGRKKAVILLVNKPDWFEPGELTYLGFDNDASEIPMIGSGDKIDFSLNFSDSSKKFNDGTSYDGTIQGPKKILRLQTVSGSLSKTTGSASYDCTSGKFRLLFPRKRQITLQVGPRTKIPWQYYPQALNTEGESCSKWNYGGVGYASSIAYCNNTFAIMSYSPNYPSYSTNGGITWYRGTMASCSDLRFMTSNNSYFVAGGRKNTAYSSDGRNWTLSSFSVDSHYIDDDISWDGTRFFSIAEESNMIGTVSYNGSNGWEYLGQSLRIADYDHFKYGGGYYVKKQIGANSNLRASTDIFYSTYTSVTLPLSRNSALNYGPGYWAILTQYGDIMCSTNASASSWSIIDGSSSDTTSSSLYKLSGKEDWVGLCYGNYNGGRWVAYTRSGDVAVYNSPVFSTISWLYGYIQFRYTGDSSRYNLINRSDDYEAIYKAIYGSGSYTRASSKTFTIAANEIYARDNEGNYYVEFDMTDITVNSISYAPAQRYVSTVAALNAQVVDWGNQTAKIPSGFYISGSYSNFNSTDMFHRLNYSSFNPLLANKSYSSDISMIFDAYLAPISASVTVPESSYTADFSGMVRLFSQNTRDSAYHYGKVALTASDYNDKANMLAHVFSMPYNSVLYYNGYQDSGQSAQEAVAAVTTKACSQLKSTYGSNLRIYVVKYRAQSNYKTFPIYNVTQSNAAHDYSAINGCAYATYTADNETDLKSKLDTIADNIKSWAGYTAAKNVD